MIRRIFPVLATVLFAWNFASAQLNLSSGEPTSETTIEFEQTIIDLGKINYGDTAHFVFKFKNVGQADLLIDNVKPSCTCTSLIYPEKPIAPGKTGEIKASIDTEDKTGDQAKWLMVFYNGNPPVERLTLHFSVLEPVNKPDSPKPLEVDKQPEAPAPAPAATPTPPAPEQPAVKTKSKTKRQKPLKA